jgi:hypothetical protein
MPRPPRHYEAQSDEAIQPEASALLDCFINNEGEAVVADDP